MSIRRRHLLFALAVASLSAVIPSTSLADPFGSGQPGQPNPGLWVADGADHWYCLHDVPAVDQWRYHNALAILDVQTDMYDVHTPTCGTATDIVFIVNNNIELNGLTGCMIWVLRPSVCDQAWVAVSPANVHAGYGTAGFNTSYNKTIGHETGHTVGLTHNFWTISTMRSGPIHDLGWFNYLWTLYEPHHVDHINAQY
ncbi:MAG: hypothetical protein CMJ69_05500 [Planctomycetaceae bacterium]|jgi:hypothetical protein|nr:hypothetical protein [Planctomycetaceae bacterium]|tara:strand:- start:205 stop:798 length:594 start_codon:yes stop_codon:yes gene_type:complete